jgi:large subunit ribosomal protein L3
MRTGLVARKVGMSAVFDRQGRRVPVTLLRIEDCQVTAHKTPERDGYTALQLGIINAKIHRVSKPLQGHFKKSGVDPKVKLYEFKVDEHNILPIGQVLTVSHFRVGASVDVSGYTKGRGFAGVMKRHNFRGLEATHGVSVTHRSHGSTGQRQDPGKVFKGKKMAGHYGCEKVTIQNLEIVHVDVELGILAVKGAVPGYNGSFVIIKDAVKNS